MTRSDYPKLLEVLSIPHTADDIKRLPEKLDTLKEKCQQELPLLPVQRRKVNIDPASQPTRPNVSPEQPFESWQYWYTPAMLFQDILSSQLASTKMHFGMAEYVDSPTEVWHCRAWGSSIRTVSGQFVSTSAGDFLFPSDFVEFEPIQIANFEIPVSIARITFVGLDRRSNSHTHGKVVLTLQPVVYVSDLIEHIPATRVCHPSSLVLIEEELLELPASAIQHRVQCHLDRKQEAPGRPIKHVVNLQRRDVRSPSKLHTLRAELELEQYGRESLISLSSEIGPSLSMPFFLFIDGFGIFRNTYRSLKGFYLTPASLPYAERRREKNMFTLTLGPHGATMPDIVKSLESELQVFEKGVRIVVNGETTTVCAFTMALTGDMPQQAVNSGALSHNAKIGCRSCYCPSDKRGDLQYNVISHGRYHYDTLLTRKEGNAKSGTEQKKFWKKKGLLPNPSPLEHLFPALDLILSRSYDIPHSEWKGLGKNLQELLTSVLTPAGLSGYMSAFLHFPVPEHWGRIQNPKAHLGSWSLSEHGLAAVMTPLVLRCHSKPEWFKEQYLEMAGNILKPLLPRECLSVPPCHMITYAYACFAMAVSATGALKSYKVSELHTIVLKGREAYQRLLQATSTDCFDGM